MGNPATKGTVAAGEETATADVAKDVRATDVATPAAPRRRFMLNPKEK